MRSPMSHSLNYLKNFIVIVIFGILYVEMYLSFWRHKPVNEPVYLKSSNARRNSFPEYNNRYTYLGEKIINGSSDIKQLHRNLILGIAFDTDAKYFAVFCGSFRKFATDANAVIFINAPVPAQHIDIATAAGVQIIAVDLQEIEPAYLRKYHPSSLRWELFHRYLTENDRYLLFNYIWLNDVRDTVFQSNPFSTFPINKYSINAASNAATKEFFYTFKEEGQLSIADSELNKNWIADCFNQETYDEILDKPIVSSGASVGSVGVVLRYTEVMHRILSGKSFLSEKVKTKFPQCERNGVDQGIHNVIIHKGLVQSIQILGSLNGIAIHMQPSSRLVISDNQKKVLNSNNSMLSVVHQYDRNFPLMQSLASEYVTWINISDPKQEWDNEPSCSTYSRIEGADLFAGRGDVKMIRAMSAASCCAICTKMQKSAAATVLIVGQNQIPQKCNAFVFNRGECYLKYCGQNDVNSQYASILSGNINNSNVKSAEPHLPSETLLTFALLNPL